MPPSRVGVGHPGCFAVRRTCLTGKACPERCLQRLGDRVVGRL